MSRKRVSYYYDRDVGAYTFGAPHSMKPHRIGMTHELITAYGMLDKMTVLKPPRASPEQMTAFHTDEYIHFLSRVTPETTQAMNPQITQFLGFPDDNPPFDGVFEYHSISAGGSIAAARSINSGAADIVINWAGGLHHAKKAEASGFCYVNDINLCILELLHQHPRVLYVDIDCHHGDGVEEAFLTTDRVLTLSFHKAGNFFPGTGTRADRGKGRGKGYSVNVPLQDGLSDESFQSIFDPVCLKIVDVFQPSVVILQCGADSLSGDRLGCFNVTMQGHANCVQFFKKVGLPLILLGGGGYTIKNVARAWTYETACALGIEKDLDVHLPWHDHFECFGPRFRLEVAKTNAEDENLKHNYLDKVRTDVLQQLSELSSGCAPSVGLHDVPKGGMAKAFGMLYDNEEPEDDLDRQLYERAHEFYNLVSSSDSEDEMDIDIEEEEPKYQRGSSVSSTRSRPGRKMSIVTNRWHTVDSFNGTTQRRRFFKSAV